jgi:hypothetical protein
MATSRTSFVGRGTLVDTEHRSGPIICDELDFQDRRWRRQLALPGQFKRVRHEQLRCLQDKGGRERKLGPEKPCRPALPPGHRDAGQQPLRQEAAYSLDWHRVGKARGRVWCVTLAQELVVEGDVQRVRAAPALWHRERDPGGSLDPLQRFSHADHVLCAGYVGTS